MFRILTIVFRNLSYTFIALGVFLTVLVVAILLPNIPLVVSLITNSSASLISVLKISLNLLTSLKTNFTLASAIYTVLISFLFGINMALFAYYFKQYKSRIGKDGVATSTLGALAGAFGIGCASCGSLILTSVLSILGISGSLTFLPFGGQEFGFIGVGLLGISTYILLKKIGGPVTCTID